jgi:hypothetical protein
MFRLYTALHFLTLYTAHCILHTTVGKTIQAIAMILDNRPDPKDKAQKAVWDLSDLRHDVDPKVRIHPVYLLYFICPFLTSPLQPCEMLLMTNCEV